MTVQINNKCDSKWDNVIEKRIAGERVTDRPNVKQLGPIMLDIEGTVLSVEDKRLLQHDLVGGIIFFSRNYESADQIRSLVNDIRAIRPDIVLAVDQEGGRVQRFKLGYTLIPPMQSFLSYREKQTHEKTLELIQDVGWLMAAEILASGIDISFAPVLDVDESHCSIIADRSFASDPKLVAEFGRAFIDGMHDAGMSATGKHFPGHGAVTTDSHLELPVDHRSFEKIHTSDLIPFSELIHLLDAVMPAHIIFTKVDRSPVGFSTVWLKEILQQQMKFEGVIFSDDLSMEGAASAGSYGDRAEQALNAGCDVVLVCNNREGALEIISRLEKLNVKPASGLHQMSAKRWWNWDDLRKNKRWLRTKETLSKIQC
ncbi:MAG: beta-N-acetylhexosaminidase [Cellvibrionaceae bacterium]